MPLMNDNRTTIYALALAITEALDKHLEDQPGANTMDIVTALGVAGGMVMSKSYPSGLIQAELAAVELMKHGYQASLEALRREHGSNG
jgi:hypothetical protein